MWYTIDLINVGMGHGVLGESLFLQDYIEKKKTDTEEIIAEVELVEFSPDGKEVISTIQPRGVKTITSSVKLPNGNTLIGTEKGLAEYTPGGYAIKVWLKTPITTLHVH